MLSHRRKEPIPGVWSGSFISHREKVKSLNRILHLPETNTSEELRSPFSSSVFTRLLYFAKRRIHINSVLKTGVNAKREGDGSKVKLISLTLLDPEVVQGQFFSLSIHHHPPLITILIQKFIHRIRWKGFYLRSFIIRVFKVRFDFRETSLRKTFTTSETTTVVLR